MEENKTINMNSHSETGMRAAVFVPDGVGVRNFVIGEFLDKLAARAKVSVFHVIPEDNLDTYASSVSGDVEWRPMLPYEQPHLPLFLQGALEKAHLYWGGTMAMRRALNRPITGPLRWRAFKHSSRLLGKAAAGPRRLRWLERLHCAAVERQPEVEQYRQIFRSIRPNVLFSSHQRPTAIIPAVLAARSLGIPTVTFIFSWDNLSSKGRIAAPFDHYLVWSRHMHDELRRFYPHLPPESIHIVGTPQFEPYAAPQLLWSREEFCAKAGADPKRPIICYSGGDAGTCPEDPKHLGVLMEFVRAGRIRHNPQVLLRPVPVDDGKRYQAVLKQFPEIIYCQPAWFHADPGNWRKVIPWPEDVRFLANLTHHADLNVNLGSTMTLDFGLHDKPVVNLAFDCANPPIFGMPVWDYYYQYEHFRPVIQFGAARFARSPEQLADEINVYLDHPETDREGRRRLADMQVDVPLGESSKRTVEALERIAC